jgi:putative ABC transport system permease protein
LGLLGLTVYLCNQRRKEFAIRKVLGSSTGRILGLMSKDFLRWIVLANCIAWPLAYFAMEELLSMYAYRTETDFSLYLLSGLGTMILAIIVISYQTIKSATANPVEALKYE